MTLDSQIAWRFAALSELQGWRCGDVDTWLSEKERRELARLRDANRRSAWLTARFLVKQLIRQHWRPVNDELREIEVSSLDSAGKGVRPQATLTGRRAVCSLSISHTDTAALAAVSTGPAICVGVDLVQVQSAGPGFAQAWFDAAERALLAAGDDLEFSRLWAVKEAVYKAVNRGEPFAPRRVKVRRRARGEYRCLYRGRELGDRCRIRTWLCGDHVAALAALERRVESSAAKAATEKNVERRAFLRAI
jgi:phosphopantetheinyl transferase